MLLFTHKLRFAYAQSVSFALRITFQNGLYTESATAISRKPGQTRYAGCNFISSDFTEISTNVPLFAVSSSFQAWGSAACCSYLPSLAILGSGGWLQSVIGKGLFFLSKNQTIDASVQTKQRMHFFKSISRFSRVCRTADKVAN